MIDLHTHTNYSDGTWNLKKLLEEAEKTKIEVLSITDHDRIDAYKELERINANDLFSGRIVTGVEFSTVFDGVMFHLLAYDFDYKKLANFIYENYESKKIDLKKEFDYMIESCNKNNIKLGNLEYKENMGWPIDIIFPEIKKHGALKSPRICRVLSHREDGTSYSLQWEVESSGVLHRWHLEQGAKLNGELSKIFKDKVVGFPTLMEVME